MDLKASHLGWHMGRTIRPLRRFVMRHLYRDDERALEKSIFVAGTARSGTTWLGDLLAGENGRILFEPFHPYKITALRHLPYFPYLPLDATDKSLYKYSQQVFNGSLRHPWVDREVTTLRPTFRVIKEVRANLMLKWLHTHFPQVPQLLILRHPCAVVLSRLQLQWATDSDIASFLAQPKLVADFLEPYLPLIEQAQTAVEKHAIIWCISYLIPFRQFALGELPFCFYEALCRYPEQELNRIGRMVNRSFSEQTIERLQRPSATTIASSAVLRGEDRITQWQTALTAEQIRQILAIVSAFGLDYLYNEQPYPQMANSMVNDVEQS